MVHLPCTNVRSLHRLCTHFWQHVHKIKLLPAPFLQTPQSHLPCSSAVFVMEQLNITIIFWMFIFKPLTFVPAFFFYSLLMQLCLTLSRQDPINAETDTHHFNGHFPGKSGLDSFPLDSQFALISVLSIVWHKPTRSLSIVWHKPTRSLSIPFDPICLSHVQNSQTRDVKFVFFLKLELWFLTFKLNWNFVNVLGFGW